MAPDIYGYLVRPIHTIFRMGHGTDGPWNAHRHPFDQGRIPDSPQRYHFYNFQVRGSLYDLGPVWCELNASSFVADVVLVRLFSSYLSIRRVLTHRAADA